MKINITLLGLLSLLVLTACSQAPTGNTIAGDSSDYLRIAKTDITEDMTKYVYDADGVEVKYFAVLDEKGNTKTAFDACDVCGGHKGYDQEGDQVVCNNCGLKFSIADLGTENKAGGGCWPSHLEHIEEDEYIYIKKSDLESARFRFV